MRRTVTAPGGGMVLNKKLSKDDVVTPSSMGV